MVKLDLKDTYLTIPMAKESWNLLAFQAGPSHKLMQFRCLPFGLCTAPFAFSKTTKPITQFLRQLGIHLIIYLDDLLLAAPTKEQLLVNLSTALWLFTSLGFLINIPKSITTPICRLEFLGFIVDTETMTISLPTHKIHAIQKEVSRLLSLKKVPVRDLACLIGTLVATKPAVWTGSLHYRALQDLKIRSLRQHLSDQTAVNLSEEARADLQWWFSDLSSNCSAMMVKPEASIVIESDASKSGWGAVCQGVATGGRWTSEEAGLHINLLELQAVFLALQSFLKDKTKVAVLVRSDNRTAIAYFEQDGQSNKIPALSVSPGDLGVVPPALDFSTCRIPGREGQRVGRLGISSSRQQRLATPAIDFRGDQPPFGSLHYRSFREQNECPAASLLQLETRPTGESGGCIFNNMVTGPALSLPTFQLDWEGTHEDPHRGGRFCLSDSSSLASPGVVLAGVEDVGGEPGPSPHGAGSAPESSFESSPPNTGESDVFNRVACLRQGFSSQGFSERVTELLLQSWRSNTHSAYNSAWSKWCGWCSGRHINPLSASLGIILEFLADQFDLGLQYRSLNTLRSAISNSHSQIDSVNVGSHPIVSRLLKGMFNARPPAPRYSGSWDVAIVVEYLRSCPSESLSILELGKKVVTLMALANASRCSDLAALDRDYLRWTPSGAQFTVVQLTKTRTPGPPKSVHYSSLSEDAEVCPVSSLRIYLSKTTDRAATVTLSKPVFLTSRRPFRRARPGTLGQWIKDCLGRAGVDTGKFTAHSTRSASSSQARARGVPIAEILKVANWSSRSTFERFYYRSEGSAAFTRAVLQPELSSRYVMCFKRTTS